MMQHTFGGMKAIGWLSVAAVALLGMAATSAPAHAESSSVAGERMVTIYDQGEKRVVLTKSSTVRQTLEQAGVSLASHDKVEPALETKYVAYDYTVNIYRAHPVTIIDGMRRQQVMTPHSSARDIVEAAGVAVRDEDKLTLAHSVDVFAEGVGEHVTIERSVPVQLMLYGVPTQVYTRAATVAELIKNKGITLSKNDTVSTALDTPIVADMTIEIWREGTQTVTIEQPIEFSVRQVLASDKPVGFREVQTPGIAGKKKVVYEVTRQQGQEVSRKVIQEVVVAEPAEQVELVGNKPTNGLTAGKGAQQFTDSRGVSHRETYYDLPMNIVMSACGGGDYTIRSDGAKIDKDGYILVAAHLGNYPRCSVVETSLGLGKVYDTGGFTAKHPHGFDLATDWTNNNGR